MEAVHSSIRASIELIVRPEVHPVNGGAYPSLCINTLRGINHSVRAFGVIIINTELVYLENLHCLN